MLDGEFVLRSPHVFAMAKFAMKFAPIYVRFEKFSNREIGIELPVKKSLQVYSCRVPNIL